MSDNTNRFGLNTYSQGDTNWDHTDTVQTIDELAIERGAAVDRPASGNYDDELYLATDQQILYRWDADATDWIVEGVGSESDPLPKVWANEIEADSVSTEDTHTKRTNSKGHHYAAEYDGDDVDERLSNALDEASRGDVIYLENNAVYAEDQSFPQGSTIVGNSFRDFGARIDSGETWDTSAAGTQFEYIRIEGELILLNKRCTVSNASEGDITVDDDHCLLNMLYDVSVTFESGTEGGMVGVRNDRTSITDSGDNKVLSA